MGHITVVTTPDFEEALARLMQARGIRSKSEAVRTAVEEAAKSHLEERASVVQSMWGAVARLPGARTAQSAEELQREIDGEMEAKLERLARGAWSSTLRE